VYSTATYGKCPKCGWPQRSCACSAQKRGAPRPDRITAKLRGREEWARRQDGDGDLRKIADPNHPEHDSMLRWAGGEYDPDAFNPDAVVFDNPRKRWRRAFEP
jgi:hypothetical protein